MDERHRELERSSLEQPSDPAAFAEYARALERGLGRKTLYGQLGRFASLGHPTAKEMLTSWSPTIAWSRSFDGFRNALLGSELAYVTARGNPDNDGSVALSGIDRTGVTRWMRPGTVGVAALPGDRVLAQEGGVPLVLDEHGAPANRWHGDRVDHVEWTAGTILLRSQDKFFLATPSFQGNGLARRLRHSEP